jgi:hypothetical protein
MALGLKLLAQKAPTSLNLVLGEEEKGPIHILKLQDSRYQSGKP